MSTAGNFGWRVTTVVAEGNRFRAYASYQAPEAKRTRGELGPTYRLSDRGRTPEEAIKVLLCGCKLHPKWNTIY